jgi:hypothetical protein
MRGVFPEAGMLYSEVEHDGMATCYYAVIDGPLADIMKSDD